MYRTVLSLTLLGASLLQAQTTQPPRGLTSPPAEASQFDYLIGEWRFSATSMTESGPPRFGGVWKAWRALDGWGIEDEYRIVDPAGTTRYLGYTVRVYQPATGTWLLSFLDVLRGTFHEQHARREADGMHLWWNATDARGAFQSRVRYYDITPQAFRWQQDRSYDGGRTWIDGYIRIEATRTAAVAQR